MERVTTVGGSLVSGSVGCGMFDGVHFPHQEWDMLPNTGAVEALSYDSYANTWMIDCLFRTGAGCLDFDGVHSLIFPHYLSEEFLTTIRRKVLKFKSNFSATIDMSIDMSTHVFAGPKLRRRPLAP